MTDTNQPQTEAADDRAGTADADRAGDAATASRRSVLLAAAAAGTVGIPGRVRGRAEGTRSAGAVRVGSTERHRRLASAVVADVRRDHPEVDVSVGRSSFDRFLAGRLDAYVSDRPMLPVERCRAADAGLSYEGVELAVDGAALVHEGSAWYDTLSAGRLVGTWSGAGGVGTYAEVDAADAERAARVLGGSPDLPAPGDVERAVVRGTRAFQYERGFGGLGYYAPSAGVIRPPSEGGDGAANRTPLVRLAYLYVNGEAARRPAVAALERAYRNRAARTTGSVGYAADPTGLAD